MILERLYSIWLDYYGGININGFNIVATIPQNRCLINSSLPSEYPPLYRQSSLISRSVTKYVLLNSLGKAKKQLEHLGIIGSSETSSRIPYKKISMGFIHVSGGEEIRLWGEKLPNSSRPYRVNIFREEFDLHPGTALKPSVPQPYFRSDQP
jgi:hypothetical protein